MGGLGGWLEHIAFDRSDVLMLRAVVLGCGWAGGCSGSSAIAFVVAVQSVVLLGQVDVLWFRYRPVDQVPFVRICRGPTYLFSVGKMVERMAIYDGAYTWLFWL